jgi:acetolactate synthase-1/2/3 large subunit
MLDKEAEYDLTFEQRYTRYPAFRPTAEEADIKAALKELKEAAKPIIVVGGGAVKSEAGTEVVALADKLQIPIATSLHARALVPDDHALGVGVPGSYSRWCANKAVSAADLVFFIGSHTGGQVTNGWSIPKIGTRTIQLDIDPNELGRNYPNAVSMCGDAKATLTKMLAEAGLGHAARRVAGTVPQLRRRLLGRERSVAQFGRGADPPRAHRQGTW